MVEGEEEEEEEEELGMLKTGGMVWCAVMCVAVILRTQTRGKGRTTSHWK